MNRSLNYLIILTLFLSFIISCSSIPKKELDEAKIAIEESEKVNANKYSPEVLKSAKTEYDAAQAEVKKEEYDKAKEKAISAKKNGWKAYFQSLTEFNKSEKATTQKTKDDAKSSHADVAVPDKYNQADQLFTEAQQEMEKVNALSQKLKKLEKKEK